MTPVRGSIKELKHYMWQYNYSSELYHHGILGQKWGVRRYQNKDGSLTALGKKHTSGLEKAASTAKKVGKVVSDSTKPRPDGYQPSKVHKNAKVDGYDPKSSERLEKGTIKNLTGNQESIHKKQASRGKIKTSEGPVQENNEHYKKMAEKGRILVDGAATNPSRTPDKVTAEVAAIGKAALEKILKR